MKVVEQPHLCVEERPFRSVMLENLERLMLLTRTNLRLSFDDKIVNTMPPANHPYVSELGKVFVLACRISWANG